MHVKLNKVWIFVQASFTTSFYSRFYYHCYILFIPPLQSVVAFVFSGQLLVLPCVWLCVIVWLCACVRMFRPLSDSSSVSTPCSVPINPRLIPTVCPEGANEICQSGHDHLYSADAHQRFDLQNTPNPPQVIVIGIVNTKKKAILWLGRHQSLVQLVDFFLWSIKALDIFIKL